MIDISKSRIFYPALLIKSGKEQFVDRIEIQNNDRDETIYFMVDVGNNCLYRNSSGRFDRMLDGGIASGGAV